MYKFSQVSFLCWCFSRSSSKWNWRKQQNIQSSQWCQLRCLCLHSGRSITFSPCPVAMPLVFLLLHKNTKNRLQWNHWQDTKEYSNLRKPVLPQCQTHVEREPAAKHLSRNVTRGQSNLTKSASRGAHSPVRGHPRGSKVVPLNSWGRVSY